MLKFFKNISVFDYSNVRLLSGEQQNDRECSNRGQSQKDELMQFQKTFETDDGHYPTVYSLELNSSLKFRVSCIRVLAANTFVYVFSCIN